MCQGIPHIELLMLQPWFDSNLTPPYAMQHRTILETLKILVHIGAQEIPWPIKRSCKGHDGKRKQKSL